MWSVKEPVNKTGEQAQERALGFADKRQEESWLQVDPAISRVYEAGKA